MSIDPDILDRVQRLVRRSCEGVLLVGDRAERVKFVIDPEGGFPVMPSPAGALEADDLTLSIPDDADMQAIHLLGTPREVGPDGPVVDRWAVYHGRASRARMLALVVDSLKGEGEVLDGPDVPLHNPMRRDEAELCRAGNADPVRLAALCGRLTGTTPASALMVGMDPWGLDLRARFGVIRVEFERPIRPPLDAFEALRRMLG